MSAKIETLIPDIYALLTAGSEITDEEAQAFGHKMATLIKDRLKPRVREGKLRMSNFGAPNRKLWYTVNTPQLAEPLEGKTLLKFLYGDMVEELVLFLAKKSGHLVQGEQDTLVLSGIEGHRDAVIDGRTVDVKTASGFGIRKFADHKLATDDPFNYLYQISLYHSAAEDDPLVTDKRNASFLAVDKVDGTMVLDTYPVLRIDYEGEAEDKKEMVSSSKPPPRCYPDVADGMSGNRKLGMECGYCPFKKTCWPEVRTFLYSSGPRYLTVVKKTPDVPEVK